MKKLTVSHTPNFVNGIFIVMTILWIYPTAIFFSSAESQIGKLLSVGYFFLICGLIICISYQKTYVEYDTKKIRWKWLWCKYSVNLNDMKSIHYTIKSSRTKSGYIRHFELVFVFSENELRLNDVITAEDIEDCINGITDNIRLMQLYKFIENIYPEKCSGFVKSNDIF